MIIILATNNRHKREELMRVLEMELGSVVVVKTLDEVGLGGIDIPETGATLEANALIKARTIFERTGEPTLADDTGLEVAALGGAPGVYSARYAGEGATYEDNVSKLLLALEGTAERTAEFKTLIAFIRPKGREREELLFGGAVAGEILRERRGSNGFGYDPIFAPSEGDGKTFAQMTPDEKHALSHRGRAIKTFASFLREEMEATISGQ